jgi:glycolate oxidase FAD binding subunit
MPSEGHQTQHARGDDIAQLPLCAPESLDELRSVLTAGDDPLLVSGGGTQLAFGNPGGPFASHVSTHRLNRVLHYEPADLTIAVEAGITPGELNRILGEHNQMLPIDSPKPESSTLGGVFASGLGSPRRLKYGSLRDWVLGVEVMSPDGVLTKSGGMVVKNVTGYDLPRLHFGAHGSFGVITRLNLKVLPREEEARTISLKYKSPDAAHMAAVAVLTSQLEPLSVLIASSDDQWKVSIGCASPGSTIDWLTASVIDVLGSTGDAHDAVVDEDLALAVSDFLDATRFDGRAVARLSIPASKQLPVLERFASLTGSSICADPGSGLIYVKGLPSIEWREAMRQSSESCVFLALPDELKHGLDVFGEQDGASLEILRRLKNEFDPERRINRGRFILGI